MLATAFLLIAFTTPAAQGQSALSARQIVLSTGDVVFVGPGTEAGIPVGVENCFSFGPAR